jgi:hypothetical protein
LSWNDRRSGIVTQPPGLAPEWAAADPGVRQAGRQAWCAKCEPHEPASGLVILSTWLSADGRSVYITYMRTEGGKEWRIDRWIPDSTGHTTGHVERLAALREPIADRVVAASRGGRTVVTDGGRRPPAVRKAPGYDGLPLLAPPVTAAEFTHDERQVVTGHGDGRLRVWEVDSGRLEAISSD